MKKNKKIKFENRLKEFLLKQKEDEEKNIHKIVALNKDFEKMLKKSTEKS